MPDNDHNNPLLTLDRADAGILRRLIRTIRNAKFDGTGITGRVGLDGISIFYQQKSQTNPTKPYRPPRIRLISPSGYSGTYWVAIMKAPTYDIPQSSVLQPSDFGTWDPDNNLAMAINRAEENTPGHLLFMSGYSPLSFDATFLHTNSDGTAVYDFTGIQIEACPNTSGTGSGS